MHFALDSLHVQTPMLTEVQTPLVPLKLETRARAIAPAVREALISIAPLRMRPAFGPSALRPISVVRLWISEGVTYHVLVGVGDADFIGRHESAGGAQALPVQHRRLLPLHADELDEGHANSTYDYY